MKRAVLLVLSLVLVLTALVSFGETPVFAGPCEDLCYQQAFQCQQSCQGQGAGCRQQCNLDYYACLDACP